jgi:hypothetical protein
MRSALYRVLAASVCIAAATPAFAQDELKSHTRGFVLGGHFNSSAVQVDEEGSGGAEQGVGGGVNLGYGVSEHVTVFLRGDFANIDYENGDIGSYVLGNVDLGGRYTFGSYLAALRPYAELGFTGSSIHDQVDQDGETLDVTLMGGAIMLGGGLEYFLTEHVAVDGGLILGKGRFTTANVEGETFDIDEFDYTSTRLNVGVNFHF